MLKKILGDKSVLLMIFNCTINCTKIVQSTVKTAHHFFNSMILCINIQHITSQISCSQELVGAITIQNLWNLYDYSKITDVCFN